MEAILQRVAAGELTPEEALRLMDDEKAAGTPPYGDASSVPGAWTPSTEQDEVPVTTVRLHTSYRSVEVIPDPEVAQLHVTGEHWIQRDGETLVISTPGPLDEDDSPSDRGAAGRFSFRSLPKTIAWARAWREHQLTVRINPQLKLDLDVTGADVKVTGTLAAVRARLAASSVKVDRLRSPLDLEAVSSSVKITGRPLGESRVLGESSSVRLSLPEDADLAIRASNRMSSLKLPGQSSNSFALEGDRTEATLGAGSNRLTVEAVMSSVTVTTNAWNPVGS
jgi:hypothetical protein